MTRWTHSLCNDCWDKRNPDRPSPRADVGADDICCSCGARHKSGLYWREDPNKKAAGLICLGLHGEGAERKRRELTAPLDLSRFYCPHCGTEKPPYIFHAGGGNLGVIGNVTYLTIVCGGEVKCALCGGASSACERCKGTGKEQCRRILGVNVVSFGRGLAPDLGRGPLHV
jgi:hypothetical protein